MEKVKITKYNDRVEIAGHTETDKCAAISAIIMFVEEFGLSVKKVEDVDIIKPNCKVDVYENLLTILYNFPIHFPNNFEWEEK